MTKTWFIGDIHGYWDRVLEPFMEQIGTEAPVIQVGDVGIGFGDDSTAACFDDQFAAYQNLVFIRGNHDNPKEIANSSHYIEDGHFDGQIMYIGGANSIDRQWRTEGLDWWPEEELSYEELIDMIDKYAFIKPEVMVTHECPESVFAHFPGMYPIPSRTRQALDSMFAIHQPKIHIFGHYHIDFDQVINGTRFICVNQYKAIQLDI
ncbi:putative metallophosphoesterase protein [Rhizobium phage RHph_I1_18]|nr:putative metallophosphoesterase protein [Rhizobium phage RHph_I1_18]